MNKIFISNKTIFIPTKSVVERDYENGKKGDPLWYQVYDGMGTGNLWTEKEIMTLNPHSIGSAELAERLLRTK